MNRRSFFRRLGAVAGAGLIGDRLAAQDLCDRGAVGTPPSIDASLIDKIRHAWPATFLAPRLMPGLVLTTSLLAALISTICSAQGGHGAWQDPARHDIQFVTVDKGVKLEILDWGGSGRPVVLLAGSGHTAHVYDDFAPKLTDCCHVYGITRRGFGASSRPSSGYDDQRLADDVFRALEEAKIQKPVLIGHSMAGGEMTTVARQHSDRLAALVYLDAIADLEDEPPSDPEWAALQKKLPPGVHPQLACGPPDTSTFAAYRATRACSLGWMIPESELRNQFENVDGAVGPVKTPDWVMRAIGQGQVYRKDYSNIRVPVLALIPEPVIDYRPKSDEEREIIEQFTARSRMIVGKWIDKMKRGVGDARVVFVPGADHYLFMTKEAEVLREIHAFIASLPTFSREVEPRPDRRMAACPTS